MMGAIGVFLILYMAVNVTYQSTITMSNYYPVFGFFILVPFVFGVYGNITWKFKFLVIINCGFYKAAQGIIVKTAATNKCFKQVGLTWFNQVQFFDLALVVG